MVSVFADLTEKTGEAHADRPIKLIGLYTFIVAFFGWLTWTWFGRKSDVPQAVATRLSYVHNLLWNKYYVDELYDLVFVRGLLGVSKWLLRWVDQGLVDGAVNASGWLAQRGGRFLRERAHTGYARLYAAVLLVGVCLLLALVLKFGGK